MNERRATSEPAAGSEPGAGPQATAGLQPAQSEVARDRPSLEELLEAAHIVAIPTRTRFRGITVREAVVFDAPSGASEFSPFPEYADDEAAAWLSAAIEFGWQAIPPSRRDKIAVNATVPAVSPAEVRGVLARFPGCHTAKVKVAERGQTLADDVARVQAVRKALQRSTGDQARIRVDANGRWSVDEAVKALTAIASTLGSSFGSVTSDLGPAELDSVTGDLGPTELDGPADHGGVDVIFDYAEQPCASVPELVELRQRLDVAGVSVKIAADESVRKASDPVAVARAGAADLLVIKAQPLGGISRALEIVSEAGLPVIVSSALDTSVGISMGLHLAAALPDGVLYGACGLGTAALLDGDVTTDSLVPVAGNIGVRRPALDPQSLQNYSAPPDRQRWWRERITRCYR